MNLMKNAQLATIRASVFSLASPKGGEGRLSAGAILPAIALAEAGAKAEGEEEGYSGCPAIFIMAPVISSESRESANAEIVAPSPWGEGRGEGEPFPFVANILLGLSICVHLYPSMVKHAVSGCVCFVKIRAIRVSPPSHSSCVQAPPAPAGGSGLGTGFNLGG